MSTSNSDLTSSSSGPITSGSSSSTGSSQGHQPETKGFKKAFAVPARTAEKRQLIRAGIAKAVKDGDKDALHKCQPYLEGVSDLLSLAMLQIIARDNDLVCKGLAKATLVAQLVEDGWTLPSDDEIGTLWVAYGGSPDTAKKQMPQSTPPATVIDRQPATGLKPLTTLIDQKTAPPELVSPFQPGPRTLSAGPLPLPIDDLLMDISSSGHPRPRQPMSSGSGYPASSEYDPDLLGIAGHSWGQVVSLITHESRLRLSALEEKASEG